MRTPYKGGWRVKEYKPYTEALEAENAKLREQIDSLTVKVCTCSNDKGLMPQPVEDEWGKRSALLWP